MNAGARDLGHIRMANALILFDEFVRATIKHPDAATLRGLEGRFAERLQIQPSYWSQIKGRSRQIGERLARQFEQLCHKPTGWMDEVHNMAPATASSSAREARASASSTPAFKAATGGASTHNDDRERTVPRDDDERFIVGLVLTYYRRHPQRARTRLLDLLGEVLAPVAAPAAPSPSHASAPSDDGADLWTRTQASIAPLKKRR
jgi:hypothetical protein